MFTNQKFGSKPKFAEVKLILKAGLSAFLDKHRHSAHIYKGLIQNIIFQMKLQWAN